MQHEARIRLHVQGNEHVTTTTDKPEMREDQTVVEETSAYPGTSYYNNEERPGSQTSRVIMKTKRTRILTELKMERPECPKLQ